MIDADLKIRFEVCVREVLMSFSDIRGSYSDRLLNAIHNTSQLQEHYEEISSLIKPIDWDFISNICLQGVGYYEMCIRLKNEQSDKHTEEDKMWKSFLKNEVPVLWYADDKAFLYKLATDKEFQEEFMEQRGVYLLILHEAYLRSSRKVDAFEIFMHMFIGMLITAGYIKNTFEVSRSEVNSGYVS